jgi:hypothetical protein
MLLHNILVEHKIMNGAIGVVKGICYSNKDGPYAATTDGTEFVIR